MIFIENCATLQIMYILGYSGLEFVEQSEATLLKITVPTRVLWSGIFGDATYCSLRNLSVHGTFEEPN